MFYGVFEIATDEAVGHPEFVDGGFCVAFFEDFGPDFRG